MQSAADSVGKAMDEEKGSWWKTLPSILTGIVGVIVAVSGLIGVLSQSGLVGGKADPGPAAVQPATPAPSRVASAGNQAGDGDQPSPLAADADELLRLLKQANIRNSVGEQTMRE
ncbi:hypothetical protein R0381_002066 [Jeongeupia wiesaeckerbachi]|uniref:hypothetical protein n=1 Tax=Jeongeupia wiesaeckerbachi TaxID=3051218 RepID=UPI003D801CA2